MSELTPCNYCNLITCRRIAKESGKVVTIVKDYSAEFPDAVAVLVHDPGEEPDSERHFRAWFGALTAHCVC